MKCIFFPYAGSMLNNPVSLSSAWKENSIGIKSISYSGCKDLQWDEFIRNISEQISQFAGDDDYFLWGHSMGTLMAYETYYMLSHCKYKLPKHIYFSAGIPPNKLKESLINLTDTELKEVFIRLGGIPKQILSSKLMLESTMKFISRDVRLLGKYSYRLHSEGILCPTTVLCGKEDIYYKYIPDWKELLLSNNNVIFDGGHFFIFDKMQELIKMFVSDLIK